MTLPDWARGLDAKAHVNDFGRRTKLNLMAISYDFSGLKGHITGTQKISAPRAHRSFPVPFPSTEKSRIINFTHFKYFSPTWWY